MSLYLLFIEKIIKDFNNIPNSKISRILLLYNIDIIGDI